MESGFRCVLVSFSLLLLGSVVLFCGMLLYVGTYRPSLIWPALIVSLVFGSGLMPFGLTVVDEVMVGSLMLGTLFVIIRNGNKEIFPTAPPVRDILFEIHRWVFIAFSLYLLFQCARGMIVMDSFRKVRWVVFFVVLGVFSAILDRNKETAPDRSRVALWIANSTTFYLAFYLIHGVTAQFLRGTSWWDLQCKEMGTTAYSLFVVAVGAPASLIVIRESLRNQWWGEVCLVTMFITGLYYDSRVAVIVLLGFLAMGVFYIRWRPLVRVAGLYCLILFLFSLGFLGKKLDLHVLSKDIMSSGGADEVVQLAQNHSAKVSQAVIPTPEPVPEVSKPVVTVATPKPVPPPTPSKMTAVAVAKPVSEPKPIAPKPTEVSVVNPVPQSSPVETKVTEPAKKVRFHFLDPNGKRPHDIDRIIHAEVVVRLFSQGGAHALFGYGYRMSGRVISPILRDLYSIYIPEKAYKIVDDESTEAFTAWVADTGVFGLALLMALFVLTAVRAFRISGGGILGLILGCSAVVLFLWTLVINISDVFLLFFSILPSGIIVGLSRPVRSSLTS